MKTLFNTPSLTAFAKAIAVKKLWRTGTNLKKLLVAVLFVCFVCNGLQAMEQQSNKRKNHPTQDRYESKLVKEEVSFDLLDLNNDELSLIILEALKNGTSPNEIASTCQRFKKIILNICNQAEIKIENNDTYFDEWFNQFHKNTQNIIKKRLNILAKEYVATKTEEELNNLPNTIFKRIFINKWFWLKSKESETKIKKIIDKIRFWGKNQNQRFLDNTLPENFNIQQLNHEINNVNNINLYLDLIRLISVVETFKFITKINNHSLNLCSMNITDETLELILEIIIERGISNKITSLLLFNNQLNSLPKNFEVLKKLKELWITNNQLTNETKNWLREKHGNLKSLGQPELTLDA